MFLLIPGMQAWFVKARRQMRAAGGCWKRLGLTPICATAAPDAVALKHEAGMTFSPTRLQPREIGLIAAALALIVDQGGKLLCSMARVSRICWGGASVAVFNLVMVWNPGISYGLFPASGWEPSC